MFALLPLQLLAVAVVLVVAMPWHRPDPHHLFFLELLQNHLRNESELSGDSVQGSKSGDTIAAA
jgi:hypothetical protein